MTRTGRERWASRHDICCLRLGEPSAVENGQGRRRRRRGSMPRLATRCSQRPSSNNRSAVLGRRNTRGEMRVSEPGSGRCCIAWSGTSHLALPVRCTPLESARGGRGALPCFTAVPRCSAAAIRWQQLYRQSRSASVPRKGTVARLRQPDCHICASGNNSRTV